MDRKINLFYNSKQSLYDIISEYLIEKYMKDNNEKYI